MFVHLVSSPFDGFRSLYADDSDDEDITGTLDIELV
jgi:hypothetical protein